MATIETVTRSSQSVEGLQATFTLGGFGSYKNSIIELAPGYIESSSSSESSLSSTSSFSSSESSSSTKRSQTTSSNQFSTTSLSSDSFEVRSLTVLTTATEFQNRVDGIYYWDGEYNGKKSFKRTYNEDLIFYIRWATGNPGIWTLTNWDGHIIGRFPETCEEEDVPTGFNIYTNTSYTWTGHIPMATGQTCIKNAFQVSGVQYLTVKDTEGIYYGTESEVDLSAWVNGKYEYICQHNDHKCFLNNNPITYVNTVLRILFDLSRNKWVLTTGKNFVSGSSIFSTTGKEGLPTGTVDQPPGVLASSGTKVIIP